MLFAFTFYISGAMIVLLVAAKIFEEKRKKPLFISRAISKGDARLRSLSHDLTHHYSELKDKTSFFVEKQLPLHSKNLLNKSSSFIGGRVEKYVGNIRDARRIKNSGISEYFKNISEIEKGNGKIEDTLEESSQVLENEVR